MHTLELSIIGMSCGHCVSAVVAALQALDGVQVDDVRIGAARVQYDADKVSPAELAQVVTEAGYVATVAG